MTQKHHVYMTKDGRISLAGLSAAKTPALAATRALYGYGLGPGRTLELGNLL